MQYYQLKEETDKLQKIVNPKVESLAEQAEKDYTDLIKRKDKMLVDKASIESSIHELDDLKNKTLQETFK